MGMKDSSGTVLCGKGLSCRVKSQYKTHGASFKDGEPVQHLLGHSREASREQQLEPRMS